MSERMKTPEMLTEFDQLYGPFFSYTEFRCRCDHCQSQFSEYTSIDDFYFWYKTPEFKSFMEQLMAMRIKLGFPMVINSGYRCPDYNDSLYQNDGKHLNGPHTKGAADIAVHHERMCVLVKEATSREMGIGIKQHGSVEKRFIHLDNLGFRIWTYP